MKPIATGIILCLGMLAMGCAASTNAQIDEQAIRSVVAGFAKSWNLTGMPGFGDLFTEDADFVVATGRWLKGRDEIVNFRRDLEVHLHQDSRLVMDAPTIRFLRPDIAALRPHVAVVHSVWNVSYTNKDKEQENATLAVMILAKVQGKWRIAAVHNWPANLGATRLKND